jgi:Skp family chaperone for outer membrane proteins
MRAFLFLFLFFLLIGTQFVVAQETGSGSRIAIVDLDRILSESTAGKSIQSQLEVRRESIQKEFAGRENNLLNAEKTLAQEGNSISPEDFETRRRSFEKQLFETRNLFQKRRNALDKGLNQALGELRSNVIRVTSQIAEQEGYDVVVTRDSVVIAAKERDITDEVLTEMNRTVQSISLTVAE